MSMNAVITPLLLLALTGCAAKADVITFDRGAFGYAYGRTSQMLTTACASGRLDATECARLSEIDASIVKQLTAPAPSSSSVDMEQVMKVLITLGKMAM
jgi:hypothetical protein